ncbi:MAG: recombinase family protein [Chloroflexota bacterium]|nr:recombinase family protein [Dehalococcoidia bacterium]MDW8046225.1 recombinase family protein [Chloroflexota bacterium]
MRAVAYFVDGAKRGGVRRSIADQSRTFLEFCAANGYDVAATFVDTDVDAPDSPGFRQMLEYLRHFAQGFTLVVVDSLGVLGKDLGKAAAKLLAIEATGVRVLTADTGAEAARQLVDTWAERGEGTPISERVRSAMRRKAVRGEVLGRPPYGYRVGPRNRLELVPDEAVVVRYIFRLYLQEGMGIRRIAGQLNQEGIRTRKGGRWSMVTVRDILRNRVYLGTYSRFGVRVPGSHPALVSPEDFRRVQERMERRGSRPRTRSVTPFLLSGLVHCARCGNRMIGVSRRQSWTTKDGERRSALYRYYQCESRTNQSACEYNTQRAPELEAKVRDHLAAGGETATRVRRAGDADAFTLDLQRQVERLENRRKRLQRQLEELVSDAAHGHITVERMRSLGADIVGEMQDVDEELRALRERLAAERDEADRRRRMTELRERLVAHWDELPFEELQSALRELIDRVEVDGEQVRVFLRA